MIIETILKTQEEYRKIILGYMEKFIEYTINKETNHLDDEVISYLEDLNKIAKLCTENISIVSDLANLHQLEKQNEIDYDKLNLVFENTLQIQKFIVSLIPHIDLKFTVINTTEKIEETNTIEISNKSEILDKNPNYTENTLIISKTKGKIFLPYYLKDLELILKDSSKGYANLDEILEKMYILPYDFFKNPFIGRFREAFKLAKTKSNKSIAEAFDLAVELIFNYNLHPAIITACRNLDELDIYLDYLESGETDKFDCFNIIFEIPPKLVK